MSDEVRAFLSEPRFAVVATTNADGTVQQTVLWYALQGDDIVMNTAGGRVKDTNLRRNPRLSLCIEDGYRYLTVSGPVTLIDDQTVAQEDIRQLAIRYHGVERGEQMSQEQFRAQERITIRVSAQHLRSYGFEE